MFIRAKYVYSCSVQNMFIRAEKLSWDPWFELIALVLRYGEIGIVWYGTPWYGTMLWYYDMVEIRVEKPRHFHFSFKIFVNLVAAGWGESEIWSSCCLVMVMNISESESEN